MSAYECKKLQDLVKQIFFHEMNHIGKDLWGAATCKKSLKWNNLVHAIIQDLLETHKWKFLWLFEFLPQKTLLYQLRKHLKQYFLQTQGRRLQETPLASSWRSIGGISIRKFTGRKPRPVICPIDGSSMRAPSLPDVPSIFHRQHIAFVDWKILLFVEKTLFFSPNVGSGAITLICGFSMKLFHVKCNVLWCRKFESWLPQA